MKYTISAVLHILVIVLGTFVPMSQKYAYAEEIPRFNNENWNTLSHPRVADFSVFVGGSSSGTTIDGIPFTQYNISNAFGLRIQRFEIQDYYHYIVEGEIANSLTEFSALLARAYNDTV